MDSIQITRAHYKKYEPEAKEVCAELNEYLMKEFSYKKPTAYVSSLNNIHARRKAFDLHLRHKPFPGDKWDENTLVIARISFNKQRIGNGTSLLKFIIRISDKYGYERIEIEEALSEKIEGFAQKYGFENHRLSDWIASIESLKRILDGAHDCYLA